MSHDNRSWPLIVVRYVVYLDKGAKKLRNLVLQSTSTAQFCAHIAWLYKKNFIFNILFHTLLGWAENSKTDLYGSQAAAGSLL